jgi:predicted transcriptional regulator
MKVMLTKEKLKKTIDSMPDNITVDEVIDRIILLDKIEKGLDDVKKGKIYTTSEVKERLNKWVK